ncbi:hypothetical protein GBA65_18830 [Rubrobacter marinus]|uniref:Uncharacterized protein n=1 Tax=Rubrobacter marinus TaxID=2653852 RepID=A0A6G8Q176_9ACTN|nr:hypothetical protein [Rubrobacter marinus]QIN80234.1 hypothetical protein GBA65_18830 [Rubrobacter marinus]
MGKTREAGEAGATLRMRVLAAVVAAVFLALWAPEPALARNITSSGGPNGPCGPNSSVVLKLKYKGDASISYMNRDGTYRLIPLPTHYFSFPETFRTNQDGLEWWRLRVVTDWGWVSDMGSYGYCD